MDVEIVAPTGDADRDRPLLDVVRAFLARNEALHSIQYSILHGQPAFAEGFAWLIARGDGGEVVAVVTYGGSFNALVSHADDLDAVRVLAQAAAARGWRIPGVMGPVDAAEAFAEGWREVTGERVTPGVAQRMLVTSSVTQPAGVPGRWRHVAADDRPYLEEWFTAFAMEADNQPEDIARAQGAAMAERSPDGIVWLDADEEPVSVACYKARTPRGMRIGPVYTPPEHRRRGYAAAVTAATTQVTLDQGCEFACLYTDARNATANHVYESIGYRWLADSMIHRFAPVSDEEP